MIITAKKHKESYLMNGSANLNYNLEDFQALQEDAQKQFLWSAIVQTKLDIPYSYLTPDKFKELFIQVKNAPRQPRTEPVEIKGMKVTTAAQMMTMAAYMERLLPFRSLDFNCQCEGLEDLKKCVGIIDSYNEFDAAEIRHALNSYFHLPAFYGPDNCNNGKSAVNFWIAREGSPAIYIKYMIHHWRPEGYEYITDREGATVYTDLLTETDFKARCSIFASGTKTDEFTIEEKQYTGVKVFNARFWWD
jgi:hypothetical protein